MTLRLDEYKSAGYLVEAHTLEDLAHALGVDAETLAETIELHNRDADNGVDTAFGRGSNVYQRHFGDPDVTPNPCLAPIETPPFYSVAVYPADLGTAAGLAVNTHAQVLGKNDTPVPKSTALARELSSGAGCEASRPASTKSTLEYRMW